MNWIKTTLLFVMTLALAGCVTTTTNDPLAKKKDLDKAEETYIQIAYAHISRRNYQDAKRPLNRALEINDQSAGAYIGLALVYAAEDEPKLAEDNFKKAIRYDQTPEARFQYASWLYNTGELKDSYKQMERVTEDADYVRRYQAFEILGIISMRLGEPEDAAEQFQKTITLNRQQASAYVNLAQAYVALGDETRAYRSYQGFARLVRIDLAEQTPSTLWLGVQLAHLNNDLDSESSYALQLQSLYPNSREYLAFQNWKKEQANQ